MNHVRLLTSLCLILSACGSATLGDEPPDAVAVDIENPVWEEGGIRQLIADKCDSCHGKSSTDQFDPGNVKDLKYDLALDEQLFLDNYGERSAVRILQSPDNPMPPLFATPITEDEYIAIEEYLLSKGKVPEEVPEEEPE